MMQATIIKTFDADYIVNIEENESDIPKAPFSCWIVGIDEMNAISARAVALQAERDDTRHVMAAQVNLIEKLRAELHFFHSAFPQATRQYKALSELSDFSITEMQE